MGRWSIDEIRILHVDDDPEFLEVTAAILERLDERFTVSVATDGSEARERLTTEDVHCVVSDYEMPGTDGIELLESVRLDYPDLPFILYTGKGSEDVAGDAIAAGVTDYLQKKPGTGQYELLANRIENAVGQYVAERRVSRIARQFEEVTEATNDALWMVSNDWSELIYVNSAYEDIWGRTVQKLAADATDFLGAIHPDDRDRVREGMDALSAGDSVDIEFRVNAEADYDRWVWVLAEPILDETGEVDRIAGFTRDVTERKEDEVRRELVSRVVEEMSDGVLITQDETVRFANPRVAEFTGRKSDDLVGMPVREIVAQGDRDRVPPLNRGTGTDSTETDSDETDSAETDPYEIDLVTSSGRRVRVEVNESRVDWTGDSASLYVLRERPDGE